MYVDGRKTQQATIKDIGFYSEWNGKLLVGIEQWITPNHSN